MALTDNNNMFMPVAPAYGYGGNNGGMFGGNGDWMAWFILILLINGGWGMGGFGGGMMPWMMGMGMGGFDMGYLYPWLNNSQHISDGFRDQQLNTQIGDLRSDVNRGFGDVQLGIAGLGRQICETGNGITQAVNSGFSAAEIAANGRQMANMQTQFGIQSAIQGGTAANAAGIADLKYTVAQENCMDRNQAMQNTRDIIDSQNRVGQSILDKLCQLEIDGVRRELAAEQRENANLRSDLMYARGQASQVEQTAQLRANQATVANQLVSELRSCPIPSQPVYGNQPIFNCSGPTFGNTGCGCNGNGFGFAA